MTERADTIWTYTYEPAIQRVGRTLRPRAEATASQYSTMELPDMKFIAIPAALAAALVLSLPLAAYSATFTYQTTLSAAGEPVPTSLATGAATVVFDDLLSTVSVHETFNGLAANASAAHIHCCTALAGTGSAGVALGFTAFPAVTSGTYDASFTLAPTAFATLLTGVQAGKAYVNIHTPGTYAGGEIRGFLAPVPEPESYALMLGGLGLLAWARRRNKKA